MNRDTLITQLRAVSHSVLEIFELCPRDRLDFRPAPEMRSLSELGDHLAALPLVDLAVLQGNPQQVTEAIEETLHAANPDDWIEIFARGVRAVEEYFEGLSEADFEALTSRAHYGASHPQCLWLLEVLTHVYHHRGQLYVYLRMLAVPVDVEHLYT